MIKMLNKEKFFIIIYLLFMMLILSSCTKGREIKKLAIVTAIGIDKQGDNVILTCEVSNPLYSPETDGISAISQSVVYIYGKGKTLLDSIEDISLNFNRDLFFSHANILILGEDAAKEGIVKNLDYLLRSQEPREDIKIIVAKGAQAREIMGIKGDLNLSAGEYINSLFDKFESNGKTKNIDIAEYYRYYYDIDNEPVIGVIEKEEIKEVGVKIEEEGPTKEVLNVGGGAVTKGDSLIGYFTSDEIFGFNFIVNDIKGGSITFAITEELSNDILIIGKQGKFTSLKILKSGTKNEVTVNDGRIHLEINVKIRAALIEEDKAIDVDNEEILKIIEGYASREVEKIISKTLDKGQKEFKQDNFSIGKGIHKKNPKLWKEISKDWSSIFPEMTYDVNVETKIVKIGIINRPTNLRKER